MAHLMMSFYRIRHENVLKDVADVFRHDSTTTRACGVIGSVKNILEAVCDVSKMVVSKMVQTPVTTPHTTSESD